MISQKAKYAFKALLFLAAAAAGTSLSNRGDREGRRVPRKFLEHILLDLKRKGVVASRRGRAGGYLLVKPPAEITIGAHSARNRRADRAASVHFANRLSPLHGLQGRNDVRRPQALRRHLFGDPSPHGRNDAGRRTPVTVTGQAGSHASFPKRNGFANSLFYIGSFLRHRPRC